ncbi:hypothetical protein [Rhodopirellula halodulae]|uniref:hypothetical protein n=1 Tax=Rhodopirellula halodulae TaxID=2894198 RepID=UPI001E3D2703|nr:hypothetical protein [Rhodopirellula sp. JC737]MCC9657277.1 hypothetical protein [Rhodopirellula sp. JC737]
MLTETMPAVENVSMVSAVSQNETLPSDAEITRRVMKIRSSWSVAERLRRRREANTRFADLLDALTTEHTAA